jgi:hypothetical protein
MRLPRRSFRYICGDPRYLALHGLQNSLAAFDITRRLGPSARDGRRIDAIRA